MKHIDEIAAYPMSHPTREACDVQLQDAGSIDTDKLRTMLLEIERTFGWDSKEAKFRIFDDMDSGMKIIAIDSDIYDLACALTQTTSAAFMADQKLRRAAKDMYDAGLRVEGIAKEALTSYEKIMHQAQEYSEISHHG